MQTLRDEYSIILQEFGHLFSQRIWDKVQLLLAGAILSPAERTVTAALRAVGLSDEKHFQNYHRILNRAIWSSREASRILLMLLVSAFALNGRLFSDWMTPSSGDAAQISKQKAFIVIQCDRAIVTWSKQAV